MPFLQDRAPFAQAPGFFEYCWFQETDVRAASETASFVALILQGLSLCSTDLSRTCQICPVCAGLGHAHAQPVSKHGHTPPDRTPMVWCRALLLGRGGAGLGTPCGPGLGPLISFLVFHICITAPAPSPPPSPSQAFPPKSLDLARAHAYARHGQGRA